MSFPKGPTQKQKRQARRIADKMKMLIWHNTVCNRAMEMTDGMPMYRCFHCDTLFFRNEVCGDHFPHSRGARPDLKFDPNNGVCCCKDCNRSDNPKRRNVSGEPNGPSVPVQSATQHRTQTFAIDVPTDEEEQECDTFSNTPEL